MNAELERSLAAELDWLKAVIKATASGRTKALANPPSDLGESRYALLLKKHDLNARCRLVLILALAPQLRPAALDALLVSQAASKRETGVIRTAEGALPTAEAALFLLAGQDRDARRGVAALLASDGPLLGAGLIVLGDAVSKAENSNTLHPGPRLLADVQDESLIQSDRAPGVAVHQLQTQLKWRDLNQPQPTISQLDELADWMDFRQKGKTSGALRPTGRGYRSLFHGSAGTGKTLAAILLGKRTGSDVYRLDLSVITSKWIGETEKNLERVFAEAERNNWILFLDEADALLGKRSDVQDSHDRYANQEVSYLLARLEAHDGLVILATNLKSSIDKSTVQRFQSTVHFQPPEKSWKDRAQPLV